MRLQMRSARLSYKFRTAPQKRAINIVLILRLTRVKVDGRMLRLLILTEGPPVPNFRRGTKAKQNIVFANKLPIYSEPPLV